MPSRPSTSSAKQPLLWTQCVRENQRALSERFAARMDNRFDSLAWRIRKNRRPVARWGSYADRMRNRTARQRRRSRHFHWRDGSAAVEARRTLIYFASEYRRLHCQSSLFSAPRRLCGEEFLPESNKPARPPQSIAYPQLPGPASRSAYSTRTRSATAKNNTSVAGYPHIR